jgi:hypothetical protein
VQEATYFPIALLQQFSVSASLFVGPRLARRAAQFPEPPQETGQTLLGGASRRGHGAQQPSGKPLLTAGARFLALCRR